MKDLVACTYLILLNLHEHLIINSGIDVQLVTHLVRQISFEWIIIV